MGRKRHDADWSTDPWCVMWRIQWRVKRWQVIRLPEERVAEYLRKGWMLMIRDSEMPIGPYDAEPTQRNPNVVGDTGDDEC